MTTQTQYKMNEIAIGCESVDNYFDLLEASYERYEYLKDSGASESILFVERGLIDNQLGFLFRCYKKVLD